MMKYVTRPRLTFSVMELCLYVTVEMGKARIAYFQFFTMHIHIYSPTHAHFLNDTIKL